MGYAVTNADRLAMIEIMNISWDVEFRGGREKGEDIRTLWKLTAPNPITKVYFTVTGQSIAETVDKWFERINEGDTHLFEREVWGNLFDAKLDLIKGSEEGK